MSTNNDDGSGIILVGLALIGAAIIFGSRKKERTVEDKTEFGDNSSQDKPSGYRPAVYESVIFNPNAPKCARCGSPASTSCGRCGDNLCSVCVCPNGLCLSCD